MMLSLRAERVAVERALAQAGQIEHRLAQRLARDRAGVDAHAAELAAASRRPPPSCRAWRPAPRRAARRGRCRSRPGRRSACLLSRPRRGTGALHVPRGSRPRPSPRRSPRAARSPCPPSPCCFRCATPAPGWARRCARCARQTLRDFEIVAVDDGSTDGSGEALERAAAREPRLRVVHTPPRGLPAALNTALAARARPADRAPRRRRPVAPRSASSCSTTRSSAQPRGRGGRLPRLRLFPAAARRAPACGAGRRGTTRCSTHDAMANERLIDSPLAHGTAMMRRDVARARRRLGGARLGRGPGPVAAAVRGRRAVRASGRETLYGWRQHRAQRHAPRPALPARPVHRAQAATRSSAACCATRTAVTLVGVGDSLARWQSVFGSRRRVHAVTAGRPSHAVVSRLRPPLVLVFGSLTARDAWRQSLRECHWNEHRNSYSLPNASRCGIATALLPSEIPPRLAD